MSIRGIFAAILALGLMGSAYHPAHAQSQAKVARSEKLPNVPGKSVTAVVVTFPPGAKSPPHHHAGSVLVYVLSGEVRSENSATGPAKIYKAGETFFEPAGSAHVVSENASATEPATILAVFIADDGAKLTTYDQ
jgi:quercetin dioxygenase-like cupin family protein